MTCDMPESCRCQKRSLWTHKEVGLDRHPVRVVGLVLRGGDAEKRHQLNTWLRKPGSLFKSQQTGSERFVQLNLLTMLMELFRQVLFSQTIANIAEAILMRISAEQVPFLHRVVPRYLKLVTSSNFWPFMSMSALMLFVLLVMSSLFSVPTSIPRALTLS